MVGVGGGRRRREGLLVVPLVRRVVVHLVLHHELADELLQPELVAIVECGQRKSPHRASQPAATLSYRCCLLW